MSTTRALALAALTLGALAAVAQSPLRKTTGQIDVNELASMIVHEQDHVDATLLGSWIRDRKNGLRVIDVRSAAEFDEYHVPTAENVQLDALSRAAFSPTDTIVMYSQGGAHAAQAWVLLRAMGLRQVFFLSGGLDEWQDEVMGPTIPEDATPAEQTAFAPVAAVSRYFGGAPHAVPRAMSGAAKASATAVQPKRRGC